MTQDDARWMRLALSLGARGAGRVWPNPAVGCVIVKQGRVLGRGAEYAAIEGFVQWDGKTGLDL